MYWRPVIFTLGGKVRKPVLEPYLACCLLPWLLPAYLHFNRVLHPDDNYLYWLKIAAIWALVVSVSGLVMASLALWKTKKVEALVGSLVAAGFLWWFPWDALSRIFKL